MRGKLLIAGIIAIIAIFTFPVLAYAAAAPSTVAMYGDAAVIPGSRTSQMQMRLKSNDAVGWSLNVSFNIPISGKENDGEVEDDEEKYESIPRDSNADIKGSFSLGSQSHTLSSGSVVGTFNSSGTGNIKLSDQSKSTSLTVTFTIVHNGAVTAAATGQWPLVPSPVSPSLAANISSVNPASPLSSASLPTSDSGITPVIPILPASNSAPAVSPTPEQPANQQPSSHFFWYLSRTSAIAAYILLFINVCLGIGLKTKYLDSLWRRWRTFDLHQFTALLGGFLIVLHIFSLLGDSYFKFTVSELLLPMSSPYRPLWTALGTIAFYSGIVLVISFYFRRIIGQKAWRVLHFISFVLFFAILFHGINAGTDSSRTWVQWLYISTGTSVVFLSLWRFLIYRTSKAVEPEKIQNALLE